MATSFLGGKSIHCKIASTTTLPPCGRQVWHSRHLGLQGEDEVRWSLLDMFKLPNYWVWRRLCWPAPTPIIIPSCKKASSHEISLKFEQRKSCDVSRPCCSQRSLIAWQSKINSQGYQQEKRNFEGPTCTWWQWMPESGLSSVRNVTFVTSCVALQVS